jgi:hypothetical protein
VPDARVLRCQMHQQKSYDCEYFEQRSNNCSSEGPYTSVMLSGQLPSRSLTTAASVLLRRPFDLAILLLRARIPRCQIHQVVFLLRVFGTEVLRLSRVHMATPQPAEALRLLGTRLPMLYGVLCHAEPFTPAASVVRL